MLKFAEGLKLPSKILRKRRNPSALGIDIVLGCGGFPWEPHSPISGPLWLTTITNEQRLGYQPGTRNSCVMKYFSCFIKLLKCAVSTAGFV